MKFIKQPWNLGMVLISLMIIILSILSILLYSGCNNIAHVSSNAPKGTTFATSWTSERCQVLLDQRDASIWGATFGGGLSGAGGLATAFPDDKDWQLGLGISTAIIAAVTTSLTVLSKMKSDEFELYCNTGPIDERSVDTDGGI